MIAGVDAPSGDSRAICAKFTKQRLIEGIWMKIAGVEPEAIETYCER